jgi:hypothetical protein
VGRSAFYGCQALSPVIKAELEKRFGQGVLSSPYG